MLITGFIMARLSLWKDGKHGNDYKFMDRRISEMFTIGGTGILLNKYLGVNPQGLFVSTSTAQTGPDITLTFSNTAGIQTGMFVYGDNIPNGATVISTTSTTITLSLSTTNAVATGASIGFSLDATKPAYPNQSALNIQDLLWTENRVSINVPTKTLT
jgi:hypothetical protein